MKIFHKFCLPLCLKWESIFPNTSNQEVEFRSDFNSTKRNLNFYCFSFPT